MDNSKSIHDDEKFNTQLRECANHLADKLQNGHLDEATEIIHSLTNARNTQVFNSVGQLTRALHDAIVNFQVDADLSTEPPEVKSSEIHDATNRLQWVIDMTQGAADKTMDKVEAVAPIAMTLGKESMRLKEDWERLKRREITKEEFKALYSRIDEFLDQMGDGTQKLNTSLQEIILEQGYQDLTGQVLNKVITLVTDVERELVNLMRIAGQVEQMTGIYDGDDEVEAVKAVETPALDSVAEGPQIHAEKRNDVVNGQDEVDDLLSSLGF